LISRIARLSRYGRRRRALSFNDFTHTEREIISRRANGFIARVLPYRTGTINVDGAVITLIDITARRSANKKKKRRCAGSEELLQLGRRDHGRLRDHRADWKVS